jgi:hypothetical protein
MRRCLLVVLAIAAASAVAACSLLQWGTIGGPPPPSEPLPIALSAVAPDPAGDETIFGQMQAIGPCLTLLIRDDHSTGPTVLPIWPVGFSALGGEGVGIILRGPMDPTNDAINTERLELHGAYVEAAPPDAVVPAGCEHYRLFLTDRVRNVST